MQPAPTPGGFEPGIAASVNGEKIPQQAYERALAALAKDKREPLTREDEEHVLNRLIEEELLVQRAVALGLDRSNPVVRNTLVAAMLEGIVAGVGQHEPEPAEVEDFYEANRAFFTRSDRFWVRQLRFPIHADAAGTDAEKARAAAEEAALRLRAGDRVAAVARTLGGASVVPLPDGYLPANKLREYLGKTPTQHVLGMEPGEVSDPIETAQAWTVLQLVERISNPDLPLSALEPQVRAEMRRRAGDESLRAYLEALREEASIHKPGVK